MARAQTFKQVTWRKYKTNPSITIYHYLKIDGHTETPLVMEASDNTGIHGIVCSTIQVSVPMSLLCSF